MTRTSSPYAQKARLSIKTEHEGKGLVSNYREGGGGLQNGRGGGHVKFYPNENDGGGGGGKFLAMLKGGREHTKFWGQVLSSS